MDSASLPEPAGPPDSVFPAFMRQVQGYTKLRKGGTDAVTSFVRKDEKSLSVWLVEDRDDLIETIAAIAGHNRVFKPDYQVALVPESFMRTNARIRRTSRAAVPAEPESVAERHHDMNRADAEAILTCFLPDATVPGWAGRIRTDDYAPVWSEWIAEAVELSYRSVVLAHIDCIPKRDIAL